MSDPEEDDETAGEYVLGTLDAGERRVIDGRRQVEPQLEAAIVAWEYRLAPLLEASPDIAPAPQVYTALMERLFAPEAARLQPDARERVSLQRSVRRWRIACAGALALAAALAVWIAAAPVPAPQQSFVAVLQKDANSPAVVLDIDVATRRLTVRPVAANSPTDKSLELWLISGSTPPRSLGTVSSSGVTHASLSKFDQDTIAGATFAVTLEPAGGSPSGAPSGTPILSGRLTPEPR